MPVMILKPGREKSLLHRHPWIFSGAVAELEGSPASGETVEVVSAGGEWLARAAYSPASQIRARVWTFDPDEVIDSAFFRRRVGAALALRAGLDVQAVTDAIRLVHGESDLLPGVIADRYGSQLVLQLLSAGAEAWRADLSQALLELSGAESLYERSDADVRALEGLPVRCGALAGAAPGDLLTISEYGQRFLVDIVSGHKTGFYLDQRRSRRRVGELARGRRVLNCFSYTGGFSVHALAGGAEAVLSVDTSAEALEIGRQNITLNALPADRAGWLHADVFQALRRFRDEGRSFDLIILDPPKFAPTAAQVEKAARGYKDINLLAFKLLTPGGLLASFSCSGGVDAGLFQKIVAGAALDAGVEAHILEHFSQDGDHPVSLSFPEGAYLKGLLCRRSG